jgi:LysR family transcriptional regulator, glycine cleavage system transcriptional activator
LFFWEVRNVNQCGDIVWRLPPLNPLKAFEAAARLGGVKRAAAELHVTEAAVSRQVRNLEESLGVRLFERRHRAVVLTNEGRLLLAEASGAFARLDAVTEALTGGRDANVLKIFSYPTFALRWLIPRISLFRSKHPGIQVELSVSHEFVDLKSTQFDGAIRAGTGDWPELRVTKLFPYVLVPACAPSLIAGSQQPKHVSDLSRFTLIHSLVRPDDWRLWLQGVGANVNLAGRSGLHLHSPGLAYQAALEGMGVAIAQPNLVADELASGRLVIPIDRAVELDESYFFVSSRARPEKSSVASFRDLLLEHVH